jgi:integrase
MDHMDPSSWASTMARYQDWLIASGKKARSVELRLFHVGRFSRATVHGPDKIRAQHVLGYLGSKSWGPNTRLVVVGSIRDFFKWAVTFGITSEDPTASIPRIPIPVSVPDPPPRKTIRAVLEKVEPRERLMIRLAADVGMKAGEIARAHVRDLRVNDDGDYVIKAQGTRKAPWLEVPPTLADEIITHKGYLFPGRIDGHNSTAYVSRLLSNAFGNRFTAEDLRHASGKAGKAVAPGFHAPSTVSLVEDADLSDNRAIQQQLRRIARDMESDPSAALSEAKNLVESLFKQILTERRVPHSKEHFETLYRMVSDALGLASDLREDRILSGLTDAIQGITQTRNALGTGHGQTDLSPAEPRHARLMFNAAVTVSEFLAETWRDVRETETALAAHHSSRDT